MGYLDEYAVGDERRERFFKALVILLVASVVAGGVYYVLLRNWRQERKVRQFLSALQVQDYQGAYQLWGCSVENPCRYYPYDEFLKDWGPQSPVGTIEEFRLGRSYEQQSGVIITVEINGKKQPNLWVEKGTGTVGFSPF